MKRSITSKFLHRVRIRGGEFDASARAMHRQAAVGNVPSATIERKTMSTRTTFKRVALVAVAAMSFGLLTGVAANAVNTSVGCTVAYSGAGTNSATCTGLAGAANTVTIGNSSGTLRQYLTISGGTFTGALSSTLLATSGSITVPTPAAGTITVTAYAETGAGTGLYSVSSTDTVTITVLAAAPGTTYDHSTAFISSTTGSAPTVDDAAALLTHAAAFQTAEVARIAVNQFALTDTTTVTTGYAKAVTVTITGAGQVDTASGGATRASSATVAAGGASASTFYVFANGVAGVGTISISVNGVVVSTKAYTFTGTLASYTLGTPSKTIIGVGATGTVLVGGLDASGNVASAGTIFAVSSAPTVATVTVSGQTVSVLGVAVGTSVITVEDSTTAPTMTKTFTVTVGKATAKTVTMTTDKSSYAPGEKIVLTVSAVGSDGTAVGDNATFHAFSGVATSNVALQGTMPGTATVAGDIALVGGVTVFTLYAPLAGGTVTISTTEGASTDNVIAGGTAAAIAVSFDVAIDTSAVDAANAATDAANYAADAADAATTAAEEATAAAVAAQDSADAATAAVVALGLRVAVLYAATRAQITSLSNLVVRLIKKAHA